MPPADPAYHDPNVQIQRQTHACSCPLISVLYGGFLPAGLFIYWIVTTIFSIVQQYLIVGWGSMFPLRLDARVRAGSHARASRCDARPPLRSALARRREPGHQVQATQTSRPDRGQPHRIRGGHGPPARTRPPGPPREKTLT